MKFMFVLALPFTLNAASPAPYWGVQIGAVRGNEIGSLNQRLGPQGALQFTLPLSERQELRAGLEAFDLKGKDVPAWLGNTNSWPPQSMGTGLMRRSLNAQLLNFDYRFHFLQGGTGPYFAVGVLGGRLESSYTFKGSGMVLVSGERSLKGGGSVGFGMQFRRTFALELRARYLAGAEEAGHFLIGFSSRF